MVLKRAGYAILLVATLLTSAAPAMAQSAPCTSGPGAAFGVTSYSCANCAMDLDQDGRPLSLFRVAPVILTSQAGSLLQPGDEVLSVGGYAITSRQGAAQFSGAPAVPAVIEVRRQGKSTRITAEAKFPCAPAGLRDLRSGLEKLAMMVSGARTALMKSSALTGRFGFALACQPSCTRTRAADGTDYWKFDAEPPVQELKPGGAAEIAGLKVGDRVVEVDGASVLTEAGALRLWRSSASEILKLVVIRNNARVELELKIK